MSRRRSSNPTKAVSVAIPERTLKRLNEHLSYEQSRSRWITSAIEERLDANQEKVPDRITDLTDSQLAVALHARVCDCGGLWNCVKLNVVKSMLPHAVINKEAIHQWLRDRESSR